MADLNAALLLLRFSEAKPNQNNAFQVFFLNSVGQSALNHLAYAVMYTRLYSAYQYKLIES